MTTIFYPDLSGYDAGVRVQPATVAVCARASLSDQVADASYADFRAQAGAVGALFLAYHWLNHGNAETQAEWCHRIVGATPLMIDAEDVAGNTGYSGPLAVQDILDFTAAYRALGGTVRLVYLPRWYWSNHMGSPDLGPLAAAGLSLVSSDYTTYSDTGAGWAPYGGLTPAIWQYTDALNYAGRPVDFNAFRGTVVDLAALVGGPPPTTPTPREVPKVLAILQITRADGSTPTGPADGLGGFFHVPDIDALAALEQATGLKVFPVTEDMARRAFNINLDAAPPAAAPVTLTDADLDDIATLVVRKLTALFNQLAQAPTPTTPTA